METDRRTFFTERGIAVRRRGPADPDYAEIDFISGAMHYWRLDRASWRDCLAAMKKLGLAIVETYVPWGVHEVGPGRFDFTGRRDLGHFLDLVASMDMHAVLRPGPQCNGELSFFGFPRRLLARAEVQAKSGQGTPVFLPAPPRMFPVPSYASRQFHAEVATWYAAVAEILAPRLAPDGPVIAVGVDNEAHMFFRLGAYDHDYHPDAVAWWHEGTRGVPPTRWDPKNAEDCIAWVAFKDEYAARALAQLTGALDDAGLGAVARFHNLPSCDPALCNLPRVASALAGSPHLAGDSLAGMDFHSRPQNWAEYCQRARYLAATARPLPYVPEVGMGGPFWRPPLAAGPAARMNGDHQVLLGLLASGVRGFNLYMAVARERWYGAPISERGEMSPSADHLARILALLREVDWTGLARRARVALIASRADMRFAVASSWVEPLSPLLAQSLGIGPADLARDDGAARHRRFMRATRAALALAQVPHDIVDEQCPVATLATYGVVIMPTIDRVCRATWKRLAEVARSETVVVVGPKAPTRDEFGRPLGDDGGLPPGAGLIRSESDRDLDGYADDLINLVEDRPDEPPDTWVAEQTGVECSLFRDRGGSPRVLFVHNCAADPVTAEVVVGSASALECGLTGERITPRAGTAEIAVAPLEVRVFGIE